MGLARISLCCVFILSSDGACVAQGWPFWGGDFDRPLRNYERSPQWGESKRTDRERRPRSVNAVHDGGARPVIAPKAPPIVAFPHSFLVNSIVIDTRRRKLYFILEEGHAYEYSISVGREGFRWTGTEVVSHKQEWPDWYPPAEMRARDASLPKENDGRRAQSARRDRSVSWRQSVPYPRYERREVHWTCAVVGLFSHAQFGGSSSRHPCRHWHQGCRRGLLARWQETHRGDLVANFRAR